MIGQFVLFRNKKYTISKNNFYLPRGRSLASVYADTWGADRLLNSRWRINIFTEMATLGGHFQFRPIAHWSKTFYFRLNRLTFFPHMLVRRDLQIASPEGAALWA